MIIGVNITHASYAEYCCTLENNGVVSNDAFIILLGRVSNTSMECNNEPIKDTIIVVHILYVMERIM